MRTLRYSINVTLDGCCDHRAIAPDKELHRRAAEKLARAGGVMRSVLAVACFLLCTPAAATGQESSAIDWSEHVAASGILLTFGGDSLPGPDASNFLTGEAGTARDQGWLWGLGIGATIGAALGGGFGFWMDNIGNDGDFRVGQFTFTGGGIGISVGALLGAAIGNELSRP